MKCLHVECVANTLLIELHIRSYVIHLGGKKWVGNEGSFRAAIRSGTCVCVCAHAKDDVPKVGLGIPDGLCRWRRHWLTQLGVHGMEPSSSAA